MKYPISLHPISEIARQNALKRKKRKDALRRRIDNERNITYYGFETVVSVEHIMQLAEERRSCYHIRIGRILPAAVLQNWSARMLHNNIQAKLLRVYPQKQQ